MQAQAEQGVAIRAARIAMKMTQAHLAAASGVSEKTVRRAEAGDRIGPESLRSLCAALGLDATALRAERDLVPQAADGAVESLELRLVVALAVIVMMIGSMAVTAASALFGPWRLPDAAFGALATAGWCALAGLAACAVPLAIPATRDRFLRSLPVRAFTSAPVLAVTGIGFFVLVGLSTMPAVASMVGMVYLVWLHPTLERVVDCAVVLGLELMMAYAVIGRMLGKGRFAPAGGAMPGAGG